MTDVGVPMGILASVVGNCCRQSTPSNRMVGRAHGAAHPRLTGMGTSLTHWGAFAATVEDGDIASVAPFPGDTDPSPALGNLPGSVRHVSRITGPAVRRGWLDDGPGPSTRRGADDFVAVTWAQLTELL